MISPSVDIMEEEGIVVDIMTPAAGIVEALKGAQATVVVRWIKNHTD